MMEVTFWDCELESADGLKMSGESRGICPVANYSSDRLS